MIRSLPLLFYIFTTISLLANQPAVTLELKFVELDESDYEVVKEELLATRLPGDFEGLSRSQVPLGFWKKVQSFPGAEMLSAPRITTLLDSEASIEISDFLEAKVICRKEDKGIGVDLRIKMEAWKKKLNTNLTLPENVQAMVGSLSNSEGRRVLVLCNVYQSGKTSSN